jgi:hypothetical protein
VKLASGGPFSKYSQCCNCRLVRTRNRKRIRCRYYPNSIPSAIERGRVPCEHREYSFRTERFVEMNIDFIRPIKNGEEEIGMDKEEKRQ